MMNRLKMLSGLGAAFFLPATLFAQTFTGRLTTSLYSYERSDTVSVSDTQIRGYQGFQIDVGSKNMVFRTYGQLDTDFKNQLAGDGKVRMYNFYLHVRNLGKRAEIKLGRQPIFGGATTGTIDGFQFKVKAMPWLRVKGFGGGLMPADQRFKIIDDMKTNYLVGGQIETIPLDGLALNLSYFDKRQSRAGYNALRADSIGNIFTQYINPTSLAYRFASFDGSWQVKPSAQVYGRSDYDLIGRQITRGEFAFRAEISPKLSADASYTYRSPRLPWNSIFAVFNSEKNHEIEGGVYYRYKPALHVYGQGAVILYSGDNSLRMTLGLDFSYASLSYVRRSGYAGELNGINFSTYYPLRNGRILPTIQFSWASYKIDAAADSSQALVSGAAGLSVRPWKVLSIDTQLQVLHNQFYKSDVRFLFRTQYWFFTIFGK